MNIITIIETLCKRPGMWSQDLKASVDLVTAIQGMCVGLADPNAATCLGDFPGFCCRRFSNVYHEPWHMKIRRVVANKPLIEACELLSDLLEQWKCSNPQLPADLKVPDLTSEVECDTLRVIEDVLRRPFNYVPDALTPREILVFILGLKCSRHPPHGGFLVAVKFAHFVCHHFDKPTATNVHKVLLNEFGNRPVLSACEGVHALFVRWLATVKRPVRKPVTG